MKRIHDWCKKKAKCKLMYIYFLGVMLVSIIVLRKGFSMKMKSSFAKFLLAAIAMSTLVMTGCTKKPNEDELTRLEEARGAAESAEKSLAEKKRERMSLEEQVAAKEGELANKEAERDDVKQKMDERN